MRLGCPGVQDNRHVTNQPWTWRPRVSVSNCLSRSEPAVGDAPSKMTQCASIVNSESRILRDEGAFETTTSACGLRRRRFSVRGPAQGAEW